MPRVEIDVDQIVTSAVDLDVKSGDRLLVMNGVVIGLAEPRRRPLALAATVGLRSPPTAPRPAPPATPKLQYARPEQVLSLLRAAGAPLSARQINSALRNGAGRAVTKNALATLRRDGAVQPTPETADLRFPLYTAVSA